MEELIEIKKVHAAQNYQLSRQILSCLTQVTKPFLKKTDMTVSEQRELGISHHLSHAQRGGGF